jgi:hypothetical protein
MQTYRSQPLAAVTRILDRLAPAGAAR